MAKVDGHCEKRFESLRALLQENIDNGEELGFSIAVEIDGKAVVDLWGGHLDQEKKRPWQADSVVNVWSTTKSICSLAILVLVEGGLLDLNENVCTYWPEFAANGKSEVKVRQIMSHTAGLPAWDYPITIEEVYDVDKSCADLAQQKPWWEPGTAWGYHAVTHGHLISQLVRRTTGKTLQQFVADDLADPLKAEFSVGVARKDYSRVADIVPPPEVDPSWHPPSGSLMEKAWKSPVIKADYVATEAWRNAEVGGANGFGNGRSIARLLSPIALGGTVGGIQYLSQKTIDQIFEEQAYGEDVLYGMRMRLGTGFGLAAEDTFFNFAPGNGRVCGWGGWGGSVGIVDIDKRMTIGYAMNRMDPGGMTSARTKAYLTEIYKVIQDKHEE